MSTHRELPSWMKDEQEKENLSDNKPKTAKSKSVKVTSKKGDVNLLIQHHQTWIANKATEEHIRSELKHFSAKIMKSVLSHEHSKVHIPSRAKKEEVIELFLEAIHQRQMNLTPHNEKKSPLVLEYDEDEIVHYMNPNEIQESNSNSTDDGNNAPYGGHDHNDPTFLRPQILLSTPDKTASTLQFQSPSFISSSTPLHSKDNKQNFISTPTTSLRSSGEFTLNIQTQTPSPLSITPKMTTYQSPDISPTVSLLIEKYLNPRCTEKSGMESPSPEIFRQLFKKSQKNKPC